MLTFEGTKLVVSPYVHIIPMTVERKATHKPAVKRGDNSVLVVFFADVFYCLHSSDLSVAALVLVMMCHDAVIPG